MHKNLIEDDDPTVAALEWPDDTEPDPFSLEKEDLTPIFDAIEEEENQVNVVEVLTVESDWSKLISEFGVLSPSEQPQIACNKNEISNVRYVNSQLCTDMLSYLCNLYTQSQMQVKVLLIFVFLIMLGCTNAFLKYVVENIYEILCYNVPYIGVLILVAYFVAALLPRNMPRPMQTRDAYNSLAVMPSEKESQLVNTLYNINNDAEQICQQEVKEEDKGDEAPIVPHIDNKRLAPARFEKYGSKMYTDEELRVLLSNLRASRPFVLAQFDNSDVSEHILCDSGASVNLMAVKLLDSIQRSRQKSFTLYRSSAVISGIGNSGPEVQGVVIIGTKIGNIQIGPVPYLIVNRVTETTLCLLGCKTLCNMNMCMTFNRDNSISTSVDLMGTRQSLPIELMSTEVYSVYLCKDTLLLPKRGSNILLSTETDEAFVLQDNKECQNLEIAPHSKFDHLDFCSIGNVNSDGKITTYIYNTSEEPVMLSKYTDIGLCSALKENDSSDAADILLTDSQALSNKVLASCPCKIGNKIFFTSSDGSTGFEPKFSLLSPYSSKPPFPGIHMLNGDIYIVCSRKFTYDHITFETVKTFCQKQNINYDNTFFVVYSYAGTINQLTGKVLMFFLSFCHVGVRVQPRERPANACSECVNFSFLFCLEPRITYVFRLIKFYLLSSSSAIQDEVKSVCNSKLFVFNIHATNVVLARTDQQEISVFVHLNPAIAKKTEYYKYVLMSLIRQLKPLFPLAEVHWFTNCKKDTFVGSALETALRSALGASRVMPDHFQAILKRAPRHDKNVKYSPFCINIDNCTCMYCTSTQKEKTQVLLASNPSWPTLSIQETLAVEKPTYFSQQEKQDLKLATELSQAPLMDVFGNFIDFRINDNNPKYGLINKDTPKPEDFEKFYDFSEYSPLEKFWIRKLFNRFASTVLSFHKSDAAVVRNHTVDLSVRENSQLPKCRAIPLSGKKLEAAHTLVRELEQKNLAKISTSPLAVSPSFVVFKNSQAKMAALKGATDYAYRLVINYQKVSKIINTDADASKSYFASVTDNLLCMAQSRYVSALDHRSAFNSLRLTDRASNLLAFTTFRLPLYSPTTLSLGLSLSPFLYSQALSHILATYACQELPDVDKILRKLADFKGSGDKQSPTAATNIRDPAADTSFKPSPLLCDTSNVKNTESIQLSMLTHADDINVSVYNAHKLTQQQELKKHIAILYMIFEAFEKNAVLISVDKLGLLKKGKIKILGLEISQGQIYVPNDKRELLGSLIKEPTGIKELQSTLGNFIFLSPFIKNYSRVTTILYDLLKKESKFEFGAQHRAAFDYLKKSILNAPSIFQISPDYPIILVCDASTTGYSSVLLQFIPDESNPHVIRHTSGLFRRKFIQNANSAILELAGLTLSLLSSNYLISYAKSLILYLDCRVVVDLLQQREMGAPYSPLSRLAYALLSFKPHFIVKHKPNTDAMIKVCDNFSRELNTQNIKKEEELTIDVDIPKAWLRPGAIISSEEVFAFVAETSKDAKKLNLAQEIPEDQLLMFVNCIDEAEEQAVANSTAHLQTKHNNYDMFNIYDALARPSSMQGRRSSVIPKLQHGASPLDSFELCTTEITKLSNPLSLHQTLQFLSIEDIVTAQQSDPEVKHIFDILLKCVGDNSKIPRKFEKFKLCHNNKVLAKRVKVNNQEEVTELKIFLPLKMLIYQTALLHALSHAGPKKIYKMFRRVFYAEHALEIITQLLATCKSCRLLNHVPAKIGPGHHLNPKNVMSSFSLDIFYLPKSNTDLRAAGGRGLREHQINHSYFLNIVDIKSGFIFASHLPKQTDTEVVKALNAFYLNTSCSAEFFRSDNGNNLLRNEKVSKYLFERGVKKLFLSMTYHSQSAAHVELSNRLLKYTMRRLKVIFTDLTWQKILPIAVALCNSSVRKYPVMKNNVLSYIYVTPYELQYKRPPNDSLKTLLNVLGVSNSTIDSFIKAQGNFIDKAHKHLNETHAKDEEKLEAKEHFPIGSLVLLRNELRTKHSLRFFRDIYQVISSNRRLYILKNLTSPREKQVRAHVSRLKLFEINKYASMLPKNLSRFFGPENEDKSLINKHATKAPLKQQKVTILKRTRDVTRNSVPDARTDTSVSWSDSQQPQQGAAHGPPFQAPVNPPVPTMPGPAGHPPRNAPQVPTTRVQNTLSNQNTQAQAATPPVKTPSGGGSPQPNPFSPVTPPPPFSRSPSVPPNSSRNSSSNNSKSSSHKQFSAANKWSSGKRFAVKMKRFLPSRTLQRVQAKGEQLRKALIGPETSAEKPKQKVVSKRPSLAIPLRRSSRVRTEAKRYDLYTGKLLPKAT